jgi:hypothetical protein
VIGGLIVATISTLYIVPIIYSMLRSSAPIDYDKKIEEEEHEGEDKGESPDAGRNQDGKSGGGEPAPQPA